MGSLANSYPGLEVSYSEGNNDNSKWSNVKSSRRTKSSAPKVVYLDHYLSFALLMTCHIYVVHSHIQMLADDIKLYREVNNKQTPSVRPSSSRPTILSEQPPIGYWATGERNSEAAAGPEHGAVGFRIDVVRHRRHHGSF